MNRYLIIRVRGMKKKNFVVKKSLRPVPSQGMVEQAKKHGGFRPQRSYRGNALRPQRSYLGNALRPHRERWLRMRLMKDIIKPEVVWEQTNTCEKEHKELSWQKSRIVFFLPHVKDRTFWKLWEFYVTSSLDRFS